LPVRVGTRGSALALAQASWVAEQLGGDAELVTISTPGDRGEAVGDKSRWVSALEQALLDGEIDVAVHSAKDVPAELAPGLELAAVPEREDPRDALCGAASSLEELAVGARVGTSSLRRAAQIRALRTDVEVVSVVGNVDTRLRKLADGEFDAIVLALAGLRRLGRESEVSGVLDALVPAAGQGALALEARVGSAERERLAALNDHDSAAALSHERELTRVLGASCNTAVGARARILDGRFVEVTAWVGLPDGSQWIEDQLAGPLDERVGRSVAERMLAVGAGEMLAASVSG
jgi:hydroxymethylbilane synthase